MLYVFLSIDNAKVQQFLVFTKSLTEFNQIIN